MVNEQSWIADKGWFSMLLVGRGANKLSPINVACYKIIQRTSELDSFFRRTFATGRRLLFKILNVTVYKTTILPLVLYGCET
jgi:hypothetical protein